MSAGSGRDGQQPPLFDAAQANDADRVRDLIGTGHDVAAKFGPYSWTALHVAAGYAASGAAEALFAAGAAVDARSSDGETSLHIASQEGHAAAVRLLIAHDADPNACNEDGETPLHTAVQHIGGKGVDHIQALLESRADPAAVDRAGLSALQHAHVSTNRGDEVEAILRKALLPGAPERGAGVLQAGPGPGDIEPALRTACKRGQLSNVRALLGMTQDAAGAAQRALVAAAAGGHVEVAGALLDSRADAALSAVDPVGGSTPLVAAADENAIKMVRWLLSRRADVSVRSSPGATALMAASLRGSSEAVSVLLAARADPDLQAPDGWNALMFASNFNRPGVARLLLDARASLDAVNAKSATARQLAAAGGHGDVVKVLDTHLKLQGRRAKAAAGPARPPQPAEDARDVEALLADLEAPAKAGKKKGGQKASGGAQAKGPKAPAAPAAAAAALAPAAAPLAAASAAPAAAAAAPVAVAAAPAAAAAAPTAAAPTAAAPEVKSAGKAEDAAARLAQLRGRLEQVALERAALDAEELALRRKIMDLEGSSPPCG